MSSKGLLRFLKSDDKIVSLRNSSTEYIGLSYLPAEFEKPKLNGILSFGAHITTDSLASLILEGWVALQM